MTPKIAVTQGLFDIIVERAATMTNRCMLQRADGEASSICGYDNGKGSHCFAGMVLPPGSATNSKGESFGGGIRTLVADKARRGDPLPEYVTDNQSFLAQMQRIHDNEDNWTSSGPLRSRMRHQFERVASDYGLKTNTVDEFFPA